MDLIALEEHFNEELTPCYDQLGGDGLEVRIDRGQGRRPVLLQVFPDTQVARISTGLSDLTLRQSRVVVDESHNLLELQGTTEEEWARVQLHRNGTLIFASVPENGVGASPRNRPSAIELSEGSVKGDGEEMPERERYGAPAKPEEAPASEAPNRIEQERVNLVGRVGTEPRFRTTRNDKLVCNFPLAVHEESGQTTWHRVVVFGERALKLQETLKKGQEVEVVGYVHVQERPAGEEGKTKQTREVWAAVVKKAKAKE